MAFTEAAKTSCGQWSAWKLQKRVVNSGLHGSCKDELQTVVCMETNRTNDGANRGQFGITLLTMEFLLRLLRASDGCLGCENENENEAEAASTRNECETNEPNTNRKRIPNSTKTEPKCTKTKPKRTQNQPNGFKTIQSVPSWLKLAQVLTPRWPMSTLRRLQGGFPNLRFLEGKR